MAARITLPEQYLVFNMLDEDRRNHEVLSFSDRDELAEWLNDAELDEDEEIFLDECPEGEFICFETGKIYIARFKTVVPEVKTSKKTTEWKIC